MYIVQNKLLNSHYEPSSNQNARITLLRFKNYVQISLLCPQNFLQGLPDSGCVYIHISQPSTVVIFWKIPVIS
jgi:hypothetical protein